MADELIDIESARAAVLERAGPLGNEEVALADALGRVVAERVEADDAVPGFDNSAMDGFAVRAADTAGASPEAPAVLAVVDESRAGRPASRTLERGDAIAISTGAMVPDGADAVVRVEDARASGGRVAVEVEVEPGRDIRRAGDDVRAGEVVLEPGDAIGPVELGVLASVGRSRVGCARRPHVHVLTTGDELQPPDERLREGGVRNSNAYSIAAAVERSGGTVIAAEIVRDDPTTTRAAIERALGADLAIVCGGMSAGEHDHVRPALADAGAEQVFWGVALRPGKPAWFGHRDGTLVLGLPGNPVSALVTFLLFARPAIEAMLGQEPGAGTRASAILDADCPKRPGRAHLVRCRLELREDGWHATPTKDQGSHVFTSMLGADALALMPAERETMRAGERVTIELLPR